jgi:VanZ family protein
VAWAAAILIATSIPNLSVPAPSGSDKVVHFLMYALFGFLTHRAVAVRPGLRSLLVVAASLAVFGLLDEWHQAFIPGRAADAADFVMDAAGAFAGAALYLAASPRGRTA